MPNSGRAELEEPDQQNFEQDREYKEGSDQKNYSYKYEKINTIYIKSFYILLDKIFLNRT